jgi:hypothetical protein
MGDFTSGQSSTVALSAPYAASGCSALAFKPAVTATTAGKTSTTNGASLIVTVKQPVGGTNLHAVGVTLPKQLSARLSTVQQACLNATFTANPAKCPAASMVGTSTAATPILSVPLRGPVYLVTSPTPGLPTLDVVLSGQGVTVDLIGSIALGAGGTTSTFGSIPDVPITAFSLNLSQSTHSALSSTVANLCPGPLSMPMQLTGQNGAKLTPTIPVTVTDCQNAGVVSLLSHRYAHGMLHLKVRARAAGRISASGPDVHKTFHRAATAGVYSFAVKVNQRGMTALRRHHRLKIALRLGFVPEVKGPSTIDQVVWTVKAKG